jgi:hypothetical protein
MKRNYTKRSVDVRFWEYVEKTDTCWNWHGSINSTGTPIFSYKGHVRPACRWAYTICGLELDEKVRVFCNCQNSICVRPEHHPPFDPIAAFWEKVDKSGICWEWIGAISGNGYGAVWWNGKMQSAHTVSFEIANGEIPDGLFVLHSCDNRRCVYLRHLFLGTHQQNMDDMVAKGRQAKGPMSERVRRVYA